jgi:hypothetical protein
MPISMLLFNPFNNYGTGQMMFGNDGGIFYAANKATIGTTGELLQEIQDIM